MRTDATIDRRKVRCPNASMIGWSCKQASVGSLIVFTDGGDERLGRMIGRVHYAPVLPGDSRRVKNWILAIVLGSELSHTSERWVDPKTVTRAYPLTDANMVRRQAVVAYFLGDDIIGAPVDEVRRAAEYGSPTLADYRAYLAKRAEDEADFKRRHPAGCDCRICRMVSHG